MGRVDTHNGQFTTFIYSDHLSQFPNILTRTTLIFQCRIFSTPFHYLSENYPTILLWKCNMIKPWFYCESYRHTHPLILYSKQLLRRGFHIIKVTWVWPNVFNISFLPVNHIVENECQHNIPMKSRQLC